MPKAHSAWRTDHPHLSMNISISAHVTQQEMHHDMQHLCSTSTIFQRLSIYAPIAVHPIMQLH